MNHKTVNEMVSSFPPINETELKKQWEETYSTFHHKIVVLDDDPTGVQTVHGVTVYTDWSEETIETGFREDTQIFFILTNSRAFSESETKDVHRDIAKRVEKISQKYNQPYLLISRGDSTLRGHYPLETNTLKETIEADSNSAIDGEIMIPYFKQGGRLTINNIHYVKIEDTLVPAGETEFANDRTFGFRSSHLGEYIEEKTHGTYKKADITYITIPMLREGSIEQIVEKLMKVDNFNKVVVNAIEEDDVKIFSIALIRALQKGKRFLYRTAATFTKIIGNISTKPLLKREDLIKTSSTHGGLIIVGSHVQKTTDQLNELRSSSHLHFIEFDCHLVFEKTAFEKEVERVRTKAEKMVAQGISTVIYTRRELINLQEKTEDNGLSVSVEIANAITSIVRDFNVRPSYLIAKGGITSSDVGTNGLQVKRAIVAGQIAPGIPVWQTGIECKFPHIPYVIFPGNVGSATTLKEVVNELEKP